MSEILTHADAIRLGEVLKAASSNKRVRRWIDGVVFIGEAQRICTETGGYLGNDVDIRDGYLAVQLLVGEAFWPIRTLITESNVENWSEQSAFVIDGK